jgi:spermidine/putrescine transport system permease protein
MKHVTQAYRALANRHGMGAALFVAIAVTLWVVVFITLPQLSMLDYSFRFNLPADQIGTAADHYTLSNFHSFFFNADGSLNRLDLVILGRTLLAAAIVTLIDVIICYPIAYILAHGAKGVAARLMVIGLIIPYWINEILRAFAFRVLFGATGVVNTVGMQMGLWDVPVDFIRADVALYFGLSYAYILLMIFPMYNAIEALDHTQVEAARDMGAPLWRVHWRVVLPIAKPGIVSGATMVFMLTAGALAAPQILGGPSNLWFTQVIYQWFNESSNWPRGSAYAVVLLLTCISFVLLMMRVFKVSVGEIGK